MKKAVCYRGKYFISKYISEFQISIYNIKLLILTKSDNTGFYLALVRKWLFFVLCVFFFNLLFDFRERKGDRKRNIDLLLPLFRNSKVVSFMCPEWRSNPQPWLIGKTL